MKHAAFALLILTAAPAFAQDAPVVPPAAPDDRGFSLMEEGAKLLFRGLMSEMEPMLDDMGTALKEMEPALNNLMALVDDIRNYDAPRMLGNGDILIPRRKGAPPPPVMRTPVPTPEGEIEL